MYFKEKEDTNIDSEFKGHKKNKAPKSKTFITICIVVGIIVIGIIVLIIMLLLNKDFKLLGEKNMTIYQNSPYIEPGYNAYDSNNVNQNSEVTIDGEVDTSKVGTYKISYTFRGKTLTRTIEVIEAPDVVTLIYLNGEKIMTINLGTEYIEPGYSVVDANDGDLTNNVNINSNVDTSKVGTYYIIYSVVNSHGVTTSETRTIIVK